MARRCFGEKSKSPSRTIDPRQDDTQFRDGKIARYQVITPTGWNASPRDSDGHRGHWEQSLIGTKIEDEDNPIELAHLVRSHDACLVCTVHFVKTKRSVTYAV